MTSKNFGKGDIPESATYVYPQRRNRLLIPAIGIGLGATVLVVGAIAFMGKERVVVGPLTAAHANFGNDCGSCHATGSTVSDEKCAGCHEESSDHIGAYSFASHYAYQSGDFRRAKARDGEQRCGDCHREHHGREATLTRPPDSECVSCHGSAGDGRSNVRVTAFDAKHHPEFEAIGKNESGNLRFTHDHHVREVAKEKKLDSAEQACLYCHTLRPGGASFQPIRFDLHCGPCHSMGGSEPVPIVAKVDAPQPGAVGPVTIRAQGGPGTGWTRSVGALDFTDAGGQISKRELIHKDPWVLFNLRRMRDVLHPNPRLTDLIDASADVPAQNARILYEEAVRTLENQVAELSTARSPQVRAELQVVRRHLDEVKRRLQNPATPLPTEPFDLDPVTRRPLLPGELAKFDDVANRLTAECRLCHRVVDQAIARVASDQRTFVRAHFDHRKHLVQRRCLDCHDRIPIRGIADTSRAASEKRDRAGIQNLPGIESCVSCHKPSNANSTCVTCHDFHPKLTRPSEISLALE